MVVVGVNFCILFIWFICSFCLLFVCCLFVFFLFVFNLNEFKRIVTGRNHWMHFGLVLVVVFVFQ
jgi:hypothetical protein